MTKEAMLEMFGCEDITAYAKAVEMTFGFKHNGASFVVMSLLSDAQEEMAMGDVEAARKTLNRAKFLLSEYCGA
jgi:hypothetical protein